MIRHGLIFLPLLLASCHLYFDDPDGPPVADPPPDVGPEPAPEPAPLPDPVVPPRPDPAPVLEPCELATPRACRCDDGTASFALDGGCVCGEPFDRLQAGFVGRWQGTAQAPWTTFPDPAEVEFRFQSDGHYIAICEPNCIAMYYGSTIDHPSKTYEVNDLLANGDGAGFIHVHFDVGTVQRGDLERIRLGERGESLAFEFWRTWGGTYGPLEYQLTRCAD